MEKWVAKVFARKSADVGDVVVVVLSDELVKTVAMIGSEGVADATAVTLHPNTINVDVKSCAIRPSSVRWRRKVVGVGTRNGWGEEARSNVEEEISVRWH